jgi:hypothetical protein
MTSDSRRRHFRRALPALAGLALAFVPARAEDPLLGRIKMIQCVGCTPGSVDLIIHDPIDVRDFQVRINESDYQKIITPLAGKTVFDKEGCFYWMDAPKAAPKPATAPADASKDKDGKDGKGGKDAAKAAKKGAKADAQAEAKKDTAAAEGLVDAIAPPPTPEIQGTPSRCIPYTRVEPKPSNPGKKED